MGKKKEVNKERHYKEIINKQKKTIQRLSKRAARGAKIEDRFYDIEDREAELLLQEEAEDEKFTSKSLTCPRCKGDLDTIEGAKITVFICGSCDYRSTKRNS